jgi:amino-acid N-acetyltransferase
MRYSSEPARPHDLAPALDLLRAAQLPDHGVAERFGHFRVVRDMGRLVGVCGLEVHGDDALLRSLAVDPDHRGAGVGGLLVEDVVELARKMGLRSVYLLTTTAREFFLARGFAEQPREQAPAAIRESWEFRTGCPEGSAFLRRPLD